MYIGFSKRLYRRWIQMTEPLSTVFPLWVSLLFTACNETSEVIVKGVWPPVVADDFLEITIAESLVALTSTLISISVLIMWKKQVQSKFVFLGLGCLLASLCLMISMIFQIYKSTDFSFHGNIYNMNFFMWLGNLLFYAGLGMCFAIASGLALQLTNNRTFQGIATWGNVIVVGALSSGWAALVYAEMSCSL